MRIKLLFSSLLFNTKEELEVCNREFTINWEHPIMPREGELLWFPMIILKDIPKILWEDMELMVEKVFWESDEKGLYPLLMIKCS